MSKKISNLKDQLIVSASKNPKYIGKEVVVVGDKLHILSTKNLEVRKRLITSLVKRYPGITPVIAYIPKENTLILII